MSCKVRHGARRAVRSGCSATREEAWRSEAQRGAHRGHAPADAGSLRPRPRQARSGESRSVPGAPASLLNQR